MSAKNFNYLSETAAKLRHKHYGRRSGVVLRMSISQHGTSQREFVGWYVWDGTRESLKDILMRTNATSLNEPSFTLYATHMKQVFEETPRIDVTSIVKPLLHQHELH